MTFLDHLNLPKLDFTYNLSCGKMIKNQQSQALTSHFESFWSILSAFVILTTFEFSRQKVDANFLEKHSNSKIMDFL